MNLSLPLFDDGPAFPAPAAPPQGGGAGQAWADQVPAPPAVAALDADQDACLGADAAVPDLPADPSTWHPALWRASQLGQWSQSGDSGRRVTPSGFDALDAQLPGGGWPHGVLTELLLPQTGMGELRLLAPALAVLAPAEGDPATPAKAAAGPGVGAQALHDTTPACVMFFDPPARLSAWALAQQGLDTRHWLVVQPRAPQRHPRAGAGGGPLLAAADLLWALEQALRSGHVGAVLAWLPPGLRVDALRRLQLAAQAHGGPAFMFRDAQAAARPSPAALRLLLQPAGVDGLALRVLKRRGPPLAQVLRLPLPPVLSAQQQAQAGTRLALSQAGRSARQALREAARPARHPRHPVAPSGQPGLVPR